MTLDSGLITFWATLYTVSHKEIAPFFS